MKPLIPIFVLFLFAGSASCENFINLTIYNNLNYTLVITDIEYHGICTDCQERLLEPCKSKWPSDKGRLLIGIELIGIPMRLSLDLFGLSVIIRVSDASNRFV